MIRKVLAISNKDLFGFFPHGRFQGFKPIDPSKLSEIIAKASLMDKEATERDERFKQIAVYSLIFNEQNQLFIYRRADGLAYEESSRLGGAYSVGVGGHIEEGDILGRTGLDIVWHAIFRELEEEADIREACIKNKKIIGFANYDYDNVSLSHIAIVATIEVEGSVKLASDNGENTRCDMRLIPDIIGSFYGQSIKILEAWSWICLASYTSEFPEKFAIMPPHCACRFKPETV